MKPGLIVYLLDNEVLPEGFDPEAHLPGIGQTCRPLETVVSRPGCFELDEAWHYLLAKGCGPIYLLVAQTDADGLQPLYPLVRLSDVARSWAIPDECLH
ncbi:MAG: hypothetical protein AB1491_02510 [Thermodesulfobacteriota bacterium]